MSSPQPLGVSGPGYFSIVVIQQAQLARAVLLRWLSLAYLGSNALFFFYLLLQISIGGDDEDDMTDEIRAAYEVFLQEQVRARSGFRSYRQLLLSRESRVKGSSC